VACPNQDDDLAQRGGEFWLRVTAGRAQALVEALDIALDRGGLDKRRKGVVASMRDTLCRIASGKQLQSEPSCWVYVRTYDGHVSKIGHARDLRRRQRRNTDSPQRLRLVAAWRFGSVAEAMEREAEARKRYVRTGDGGAEWVDAEALTIVEHLTQLWGAPQATEF
jgi:hypothetical protein